jgi:serine O-acetyltransferase
MADCGKSLQEQITRTSNANAVKITNDFLKGLPKIQKLLLKDAQAAVERDPAASGVNEIILCYPGFLALMTYRLAHELDRHGVGLIPRMMTEHAHSLTGCDIHPKAKIGEGMFIDHATGVVIGQTSVIGNHVALFQGVTLGSLAIKQNPGGKRHPTLEDDVVIYSNATILGGETVIGTGSVIGGSCWITSSVPAHSKVILAKPQMNVSTNKKVESIPNWDI